MIDHSPCFSDEDIALRIVIDQKMIQKLIDEGHQVRALVSYHSAVTMETHCLPIFAQDTMEDVCNRYYDFFPKECKQTMQDTEALSSTLYRGDGLSKAKTMMSSLRIPLGLWKLLETWNPSIWEIENGAFKNKRLIKALTSYMPKLKMQTPYGKPSITLS